MEEINYFQIVLLKLIDGHPSLNNDYWLSRFYGKAEEPFRLGDELRMLVVRGLIEIANPGGQVRVFKVTDNGKILLSQCYSLSEIESSVLAMEKSGFFLKILKLIEQRENGELEESN